MADKVSRTFTNWNVTAKNVVIDRKAKTFDEEYIGEVQIESLGKPSRKKIVEEFAKKHIHIKKGTEFEYEAIGFTPHGMSAETFLANIEW